MPEINTKSFVRYMVVKQSGLDTYHFLVNRLAQVDVSKDELFQGRFTHFYRVRRSRQWLSRYYDLFERLKNEKGLSFECVLREICAFSDGRVEISFASKMLSTINQDMPIWDKYVRLNLELPEPPPPKSPNRIEAAIGLYALLETKMKALLDDGQIQEELALFDKFLPDYAGVSNMKKLDYLLWAANREEWRGDPIM